MTNGDSNSVPGCIGYFGKPVYPNNCQKCRWIGVCRKVVARERLHPLLAKVEECQKILKGEK
ncbi:MAG: hypothetical protein ACQXXG_09495 [Candidatus Bathyarchaeia archaeon]|nr:hypothetical protein [Candidatus Bathyarchaeota archaeon]